MSTMSNGAPGLSTRCASASAGTGDGTWCSTSIITAASSESRSIGSASSAPRRRSTLLNASARCARGREHLVRRVNADDGRHVRRQHRQRARPCRNRDRRRSTSTAAARAAPHATRRRRTVPRAADPTGRPTRQRTAARPRCAARARARAAGRPAPRPDVRRAARVSISQSSRRVRRRPSGERVVPARAVPARATQPASASVFRCRLTVDCGSCSTAQSSATVSSCGSSSHSIRHRVASARAENESRSGRAETGIYP